MIIAYSNYFARIILKIFCDFENILSLRQNCAKKREEERGRKTGWSNRNIEKRNPPCGEFLLFCDSLCSSNCDGFEQEAAFADDADCAQHQTDDQQQERCLGHAAAAAQVSVYQ